MRPSSHGTIRCLAVLLFAAAAASPAVFASPDPPASAVDHSGEHFTLDGQAADAQSAAAAATCSATPAHDGTVACFSSTSELGKLGAQALRAGHLPPGYASLPPGVDRSSLIVSFDRLANGGSSVPAAAKATAASRRGHKHPPKARPASGYDCSGAYTWIYTDANFGGTSGHEGLTGTNVWDNFSATYDNKVSSFWADPNWQSRWHDYAYGGGAYYGNGDPCRYVENLGNASMTDGGTANDRFSSFGNW